MKKPRLTVCALLFVLAVIAILSVCSRFSTSLSPILDYITWDRCEIIDPEGNRRPFDLYGDPAEWNCEEGDTIFVEGTLPNLEDMPELYDYDGYLLMNYVDASVAVFLDGELYCEVSSMDMGQPHDFQLLNITLPADKAGSTIALEIVPADPMTAALPTYARFTSDSTNQLFWFGSSNHYALPAGAYALGFLLVLGLFLVSLAMEVPVWSSLLLAAVFLLNFLRELSLQSGYLFLPDSVYRLTSSFRFSLVPVFLTALYLFLNRRKNIWRPLARMAAWALAALALRYAGSSLTGGIFSLSVQDTIRAISRGSPWALLLLLNTCLTMACAAIAAFDLVRSQLSIRSERNALSLRNRMIMENYHTIEQSIQNMSSMRHEWKNQLTAISLLVQQEDLDGLKQFLEQMNLNLTRLLPRQYSKHFAVNAILQNAAARANELGIDFQATAPISEQLSIDEGDLCSLLMNMLDNALEAASHVPPEQRQVSFSISNHQNVVEIRCENSYDGHLSLDASGNLQSTKPDAGQHGFGVAQMRLIASRYGGPLEIGRTTDRFMVRTTLTLK